MLIIFCCCIQRSQAKTLKLPHQNKIPFHHISVDQGLSQVTVNDIAQDKDGFIWFATEDGLNRYDGQKFIHYHSGTDDDYQIQGNVINFVFNDSQNRLWVGFNGQGISRKENNIFVPIPLWSQGKVLQKVIATTIFQDSNNQLWLGTWADGLFRFSGEKQRFEQVYFNKEFNRIWTITEFNQQLLIGVDKKGIVTLEDDLVVPWKQSQSLNNNSIKSLYSEEHRLWIGTDKSGLWTLFQQSKVKDYKISNIDALKNSTIQKVFRDNLGVLWVATAGDGIYKKIPHKKWIQQRADIGVTSLSNNRVLSIFQDNSGVLWFGTEGAGLNYFDPYATIFKNIYQGENSLSLNNKMIYAINADHHGNLWVGTESGGVNLWNSKLKKFQYLDKESGHLDSNNVRALYNTKKGMLVGTLNGLSFISDQGQLLKKWNQENLSGLHNDIILSFETAGINKVWIGTYNGLYLFDWKNESIDVSFLDHEHQGPFNNKRAIILAMKQLKNELYVATLSDGLYRFDMKNNWGKIHLFSGNHQRISAIYSITRDHNDNLWLGTKGNGIIKYQPATESVTTYNQKNGLSNNVVYGILEDSNHHLWLSTNSGISDFDPDSETFINYSKQDGLQGKEFNSGAFYQNGEFLFFGGINGISWFQVSSQNINPFQPQTAITHVNVFNKPLSQIAFKDAHIKVNKNRGETLYLNYNQSMFSIGFAALHFSSPSKNHYAYRMSGFDNHWIQSQGASSEATFTGLPPGHYQFQVKSFSPYHIEDNTPAELTVIIAPPPWRTWWAYALYILIVGLIFNQYLKYLQKKLADQKKINLSLQRIDQLKERLSETERMAILGELSSNVAHSLRNPLASIRSSAELIEIDEQLSESIHEDASNIISEVDRLSQWIKDLLEYSREQKSQVEAIDLKTACGKIMQDHEKKFQTNNIEYQYIVDAERTQVSFDLLLFQHMLNSLISNAIEAVKSDGKITLQLSNIEDNKIQLALSDNGEGIPFEQQTKIFSSSYTTKTRGLGMGLSLVKRIVERHDASLSLSSSSTKGTTFYITFALYNEN